MNDVSELSDRIIRPPGARHWRVRLNARQGAGLTLVALAVVLAFLPSYASDYDTVVGYQVLQLAALAQAWNLLAGYAGLVSLASAAFVGLGEYATAWITIHTGIPLLPAMLISGAVGAAFAALVSLPIFRFRGLYFAIGTLVLGEALLQFMINFNGLGGNAGLNLTNNAPSDGQLYQLALLLAVISTVAVVVVRRLRLGAALLAIRDNEDVAREVGVPTFRAKLWAFLLSGALMGIVGGLQADKLGHVDPSGAYALQWTIDIVNAAIIGGLGTVLGPIVGALFIVEFGIQLSSYPELHVALTGVLLIAVIRFAPLGLWGSLVALVRRFTRRGERVEMAVIGEVAYRGRSVARESSGPLLEVESVSKSFGGIHAVADVSFHVGSGEILGIIGPNGAGKSTLIGLLSGALKPSAGRIKLAGQRVEEIAPEQRAKLGIGRTHQIAAPFTRMTVLENLEVACLHGGGLRRRRVARREAMAILELTGLADFAQVRAEDLSLLRVKRLELARALALRPRLLLLDEIAAGLVETEVQELTGLIKRLRAEVESIIVVEHVLDVIHDCADRVVVLEQGRKLTEGDIGSVMADPQVVAAYLGTGGGEEARVVPLRPISRPKPLLKAHRLTAAYGHSRALTDVSIEIGEGEIVGLLGANGAGKTTTARVLSGMIAPSNGQIEFAGERLDGRSANEFVAAGIAHCMEGRRIFGELSVEENLLVGGRTAPNRSERIRRLKQVYELFAVLEEKRTQPGSELSGGQQQQLAVGRALMAAPQLMLLDEVSLGLAPVIVDRVYEALDEINRRGVAMLVIEQNVQRGLRLADRVYVLEKGRMALTGTPAEVRGDPRLVALYVGEAKGAAIV
jgi:ABC-type branched-subunit amino acid transport system ATPase component/ABC-type branched-subunit amino acid transport system permease subunit